MAVAGVVDLPVRFRHIAVLTKVLRKRHYIRRGHAQIGVQAGHTNRIGQFPRHQARSGGVANRLLAIGPVEEDSFRRQLVKVRSDHIGLPIAIELRTQIVRRDK